MQKYILKLLDGWELSLVPLSGKEKLQRLILSENNFNDAKAILSKNGQVLGLKYLASPDTKSLCWEFHRLGREFSGDNIGFNKSKVGFTQEVNLTMANLS